MALESTENLQAIPSQIFAFIASLKAFLSSSPRLLGAVPNVEVFS